MDHQAITALARTQHGLITLDQAIAHGASPDAVGRLVASGRWSRVRRGVYVVGAAARTWEQRMLGTCLAAGPDSMAAARSAGRLWGLVDRPGRPELLVAGRRRVRVPGATVHRSILVPPMDRTVVDAIPVTSLARTLVDLSTGQSPTVVGGWVDQAMREHGLELTEVHGCLARLAGPGRRDVRAMRAALDLRPLDFEPGDSALEGRLLRVIAAAGLPAPELQHQVVRPGGTVAFIDAAYPWAMVALEAEGFAYHRDRTAFDHDRARAADLALLGWDVYPLTATMSDERLVAIVTGALDRAEATRRLSPRRRARPQ